jgi:ribosomal protein L29
MDDKDKILELQKEVDELKDEIVELKYIVNNNKEKLLLEFFRELYENIFNDKEIRKLSKKEIVENLKEYMQIFKKENKIFF